MQCRKVYASVIHSHQSQEHCCARIFTDALFLHTRRSVVTGCALLLQGRSMCKKKREPKLPRKVSPKPAVVLRGIMLIFLRAAHVLLLLLVLTWYPDASGDGGTRNTSSVLNLVNTAHAGCSLQGSWEYIRSNSKHGEQRYRAGGLGLRSTESFQVWVCDLLDPCAWAPPCSAPDLMCYAYDEVGKTFLPIDLNSKIKFVKEHLIDPNNIIAATKPCTTKPPAGTTLPPSSSPAIEVTPAPPVLNASGLSRYLTLSGHQNYVMSVALEDAVVVTGRYTFL